MLPWQLQLLTCSGVDEGLAQGGGLGGAKGRVCVTWDDETCSSSKRRCHVSADIKLFLLPHYGEGGGGVGKPKSATLTELKSRADSGRRSGRRRGSDDNLHTEREGDARSLPTFRPQHVVHEITW